MGAKSEALARQFEAKSRDAVGTLEKLGEADWKKVTEAEKWSVGVTAHHLASVLEPISSMIQAVAAGRAPVRGLSDAELATSGTLLKSMPPMTAEQVILGGLLAHIDEHYGSIRRTVGH